MEPMYVVVTVYMPVRDNLPHEAKPKPVINTYGPYSRGQAQNERRKIMNAHRVAVATGELMVKASQILDPERTSPFIWGRVS